LQALKEMLLKHDDRRNHQRADIPVDTTPVCDPASLAEQQQHPSDFAGVAGLDQLLDRRHRLRAVLTSAALYKIDAASLMLSRVLRPPLR